MKIFCQKCDTQLVEDVTGETAYPMCPKCNEVFPYTWEIEYIHGDISQIMDYYGDEHDEDNAVEWFEKMNPRADIIEISLCESTLGVNGEF